MKKYLRLYLYNFISLWIVANIFAGINFKGGYQTLAITALALTLVNLLVKPILNLLFLPLNLLTLGLFRWITNVAALHLVTIIVPGFEISGFNFPGFSYGNFVILPAYLSRFLVLVIASFVISFIISFLSWLNK